MVDVVDEGSLRVLEMQGSRVDEPGSKDDDGLALFALDCA